MYLFFRCICHISVEVACVSSSLLRTVVVYAQTCDVWCDDDVCWVHMRWRGRTLSAVVTLLSKFGPHTIAKTELLHVLSYPRSIFVPIVTICFTFISTKQINILRTLQHLFNTASLTLCKKNSVQIPGWVVLNLILLLKTGVQQLLCVCLLNSEHCT